MANPFYNYSGSILPGTLGRAEAVAAEFQSVQAGFADLATAGVDSGTAGAYVITTPAGDPVVYADGDVVTFKAATTNPGASTVAVNGGAVVGLLQYNGNQLQASNVAAGSWYTLTYNSTYAGWCLPGAVAITYTGSISGAAPVYPVTLVAAGGSSTSAMPIDAKLALSTAINPTWVGNHTFNGTSSFAGPTTISGTASISGPLTVSGTSTFSGVVVLTNAVSISGTATVSGRLAVSGTSSFAGPVTISAGLTVSGTSAVSGPLTVSGTSTVSGPLTVTGTGSASGPWTFSGKAVFSGTSTISGPVTLTAALSVTGTSTFSGPLTVTGTASFANVALSGNPLYVGAPVNSQSGASYALVLADQNKTVYDTSTSAKTITIPANASVAFPVGTMVTFVNTTAGVMSIAITTDTMYLAGIGTTGTRSLAAYGVATAVKVAATTWFISGAGLS